MFFRKLSALIVQQKLLDCKNKNNFLLHQEMSEKFPITWFLVAKSSPFCFQQYVVYLSEQLLKPAMYDVHCVKEREKQFINALHNKIL